MTKVERTVACPREVPTQILQLCPDCRRTLLLVAATFNGCITVTKTYQCSGCKTSFSICTGVFD